MKNDEIPRYRKKKLKNKFEVKTYVKIFTWRNRIEIWKDSKKFKRKKDCENYVKKIRKRNDIIFTKRLEKGFITGLINYKINEL